MTRAHPPSFSPLQRIAAWLIFPVLLTSGIGLAIAGFSSSLHPVVVTSGISVAIALIIAGLERLFPYSSHWLASQQDVGTDMAHTLISTVATVEVIRYGLWLTGFFSASALSQWLGVDIWPSEWPLIAQL